MEEPLESKQYLAMCVGECFGTFLLVFTGTVEDQRPRDERHWGIPLKQGVQPAIEVQAAYGAQGPWTRHGLVS